MSVILSEMASGKRPLLFPWVQLRGPASKGRFSQRKEKARPSVALCLCEFLFDGLLPRLAVRQVKTKVCPLVGARHSTWASAVRDSDGVAYAEMYSFHDPLPLKLARATDGDGGRIAAGAKQLLPAVVALLQVLQAPPDGHAVLIGNFQGPEILRE